MLETIRIIEDAVELAKLSGAILDLEETDIVSVDTEFIRTRTYYPKLALLQLCLKGEVYLCDPLKVQLKPLFAALNHSKALFLMFSSREDLEVIANASRRFGLDTLLPQRCLDLQLLMSFLNLSHGQGLQSALDEFLGISLDKDQTTSDWLARPLSQKQLLYAASDVLYLKDLYLKLKKYAEPKDQRLDWCFMAMELQKQEETLQPDAQLCYREVPGAGRLPKKNLAVLQHLCLKRMEFSIEHDVALNLVITSKALCKLAKNTPLTMQGLASCDMKWGAVREHGDLVIAWIKEALAINDNGCNLPLPYDFYVCKKDYGEKFFKVKDYLVGKAKEHGIRAELIASKKLINDLFYALSQRLEPKLHQSWYLLCAGKTGDELKLF